MRTARVGWIALALLLLAAAEPAAQPRSVPPTFAPVAAAVKAAVYGVEMPAPVDRPDDGEEGPLESLMRLLGGLLERNLGAAVMTDPSGIAVTSARIVRGLEEVELVAVDGRRHRALVVASDERTDIAVLRVSAALPLPAAPLGDSDEVRIGDWVLAFGSPYGFEGSVSAGIVSGRPRVRPDGGYEDSVQTDAAVNPGSVGGPLVSARGAVVGIAVFPGPRGSGIAFAVPSNVVRRVAADLLAHGRVLRGWLGIVGQPLTADLARAFGAPPGAGVLAADVLAEGPADRAGIGRGTVLLALDDRVLRTPADLESHVARAVPGQRVTARLWRHGREETVALHLGAEPEPFALSMPAARALGMLVDRVTPEAGVVVVAVRAGGAAAEAGVRRGDIVREVDGHPVVTLAEFARATRGLARGGGVTVLLQRGQSTFYVVVVPGG
jgi:serine protease Do